MKMKKIYFSSMLFIALVSISLFATFAHAATLEVGTGKPYTTIQSAINVASTGDTVLVYPRTYVENIIFSGKAITVKSVNGAASTIIDGNASDSVVTFNNSEGAGSALDGFTITNGYSEEGGGIYCDSSSPVVTNCNITGNAAYEGGGIFCLWNSFPTITNCTISANTADFGGGIYCEDTSNPVITNCTISGNSAESGGGICCYYESSPNITNCTISGNTATGYGGGGIECNHSSPAITNCTITGNKATYVDGGHGGGICCYYESSPNITNCTISANTAYHGGGIYCEDYSSPIVKNSILWDDTATTSGNEIYLNTYYNSSTITVTYSDVEGGRSGIANINVDPLFVGNGNYHLKAGSPCIDRGTSVGAPNYDIDGDPRPQGAGYDMGSDEYTAVVSYSISGTVAGDVQAGVTVTLSGNGSGITTTNSTGNYSFTGLGNGTYTVTPSLSGYTFTTSSRTVTINGTNMTGVNFTATTCTYTISPTNQSFTSSGGIGSVSVTTQSNCTWSATSNASWITIISGSSGTSNGTEIGRAHV